MTRTPPALTEPEKRVLVAISYGHQNAQIGRDLHLSPETVKSHAKSIFRKLGASGRTHAVALAYECGLLGVLKPPPPPKPTPPEPVPRRLAFVERHIDACRAAQACPCRKPPPKYIHPKGRP